MLPAAHRRTGTSAQILEFCHCCFPSYESPLEQSHLSHMFAEKSTNGPEGRMSSFRTRPENARQTCIVQQMDDDAISNATFSCQHHNMRRVHSPGNVSSAPWMKLRHWIWILAMLWLGTSAAWAQMAPSPPVPEWITHGTESTNRAVAFSKSFNSQGPVLKSILLGACEGRMSVYLNGNLAGEIAGTNRASGVDITQQLRPGTNVLMLWAEASAAS